MILSGSTGSGKTTLLYSAMLQRVKLHAGRVVTVEQPVELIVPLSVGKGIWISTEPNLEHWIEGDEGKLVRKRVSNSDAWASALREAMRQFPASADNKVLFLGEMRESVVAFEAVQAADSGHLVVLTMHGTNVISALRRFVGYVARELNNDKAAASEIVGSVLRGIFWQRMKFEGNEARVEGRSLFFQYAGDDGSPGREAMTLSKGDFKGLNDPILTQTNDIKIAAQSINGYETASPEQRQSSWKNLREKLLEKKEEKK